MSHLKVTDILTFFIHQSDLNIIDITFDRAFKNNLAKNISTCKICQHPSARLRNIP